MPQALKITFLSTGNPAQVTFSVLCTTNSAMSIAGNNHSECNNNSDNKTVANYAEAGR